jgi:Arc/MetJ-type ribon-helix-helix transcriptional regulator
MPTASDLGDQWAKIRDKLAQHGIDLEKCCDGARVKVVCVAPDLKHSVEEMAGASRDQVVMVRVDDETLRDLDAWVETGAVKSRSEAAALFIREGLKVRREELDKLREALRNVEDARQRLRDKAREVLGGK